MVNQSGYIVFDIETLGLELEDLPEEERNYLLEGIERYNQKEEDIKKKMSFWALTAHVISICLYKPEEGKATVLYVSSQDRNEEVDTPYGILLHKRSFSIGKGLEEAERAIIEEFWEYISGSEGFKYKLVSFNGKGFDAPFLMLRSVVLGLEAKRNLFGKGRGHIDLMEVLTFYGTTRRYKLDFVCRKLGIESPKEGVDGSKIKELFHSGEYERIAEYNLRDVLAINAVFERFRHSLGKVLEL